MLSGERKKWVIISFIITVLGLGVFSGYFKSQNSSKKEVVLMNQSAFTSVIEDYCVKYKQAINEANATQIRKERKSEIKKFSAIFQDWDAKLDGIGTDKEGKANLRFSVYTQGYCSYRLISTISPNHNSYQVLTQIPKYTVVKVSGSMPFDKSNYDFFKEYSFTERGAMLDPEFIVEISKLEKIN